MLLIHFDLGIACVHAVMLLEGMHNVSVSNRTFTPVYVMTHAVRVCAGCVPKTAQGHLRRQASFSDQSQGSCQHQILAAQRWCFTLSTLCN